MNDAEIAELIAENTQFTLERDAAVKRIAQLEAALTALAAKYDAEVRESSKDYDEAMDRIATLEAAIHAALAEDHADTGTYAEVVPKILMHALRSSVENETKP